MDLGAIFIGVVCAALFAGMRIISAPFGRTIGTLAGLSFFGLVVGGAWYLIAAVITLWLVPWALPFFFVWVIWRAFTNLGKKTPVCPHDRS